ncbi:EAL and HDOD domain-containing protein [Bacillus sp. EB01]|uniref:EAL and HDOD domain-containing protein n=1 Tax=Bacillus sp. EB01 TaxID=1347086 RepID=UPI0005C572B6|nr:EAL domain-containing protein [Bacillus sp. EB01]
MEVFVARQPIFKKNKDLFAYELLYRNNHMNRFPEINGELATTDVIINSFLNIGIEELSNGKPCFVNFTEKLLQLKLPSYFKPNEIIIEILESIEINQELLNHCRELKSKGYQIALDDFILNAKNPLSFHLLDLVDIIKVDFRATNAHVRRIIEKMPQKYNVKLLAEKIETKQEFESAVQNGYEYFQGYYFAKPVIISTHDVPEYFQNYIVIINQLSSKDPNLDSITELIEQDLSLSYKLLKLINSPKYLPTNKINSIKQAIVRLGFNELTKWLWILAIRSTLTNKSEWSKEIFINSLIRARMCELIALHKQKRRDAPSFFLTGMFSLMDSLLGMEMDKVLKLMPLQENINQALIGQSNLLKEILDFVTSIEKGNWEEVSTWYQKLQIEDRIALGYYNEALKWANHIMK